jgi:hypothetical protein
MRAPMQAPAKIKLSVPESENKRKAVRKPTFLDGLVIAADRTTIQCIIWDMSNTGMKLGVPSHLILPQKFDVVILDHKISAPVQTVWRQGDYVGVSFCR